MWARPVTAGVTWGQPAAAVAVCHTSSWVSGPSIYHKQDAGTNTSIHFLLDHSPQRRLFYVWTGKKKTQNTQKCGSDLTRWGPNCVQKHRHWQTEVTFVWFWLNWVEETLFSCRRNPIRCVIQERAFCRHDVYETGKKKKKKKKKRVLVSGRTVTTEENTRVTLPQIFMMSRFI